MAVAVEEQRVVHAVEPARDHAHGQQAGDGLRLRVEHAQLHVRLDAAEHVQQRGPELERVVGRLVDGREQRGALAVVLVVLLLIELVVTRDGGEEGLLRDAHLLGQLLERVGLAADAFLDVLVDRLLDAVVVAPALAVHGAQRLAELPAVDGREIAHLIHPAVVEDAEGPAAVRLLEGADGLGLHPGVLVHVAAALLVDVQEEEGEQRVGDQVQGDGPVVLLVLRAGPVRHLVAVAGVQAGGIIAVVRGSQAERREVFEHFAVAGDVARGEHDGLSADVAAVNAVLVLRHEGDDASALVLLEILGAGIAVDALAPVEDDLLHDLAGEHGASVLIDVIARLLHDEMRAGVLGEVRPLVVAAEELALHGLAAGLEQPLPGLLALVHVEPEQVLVHAAAADAHPVAGELALVDEHAVLALDLAADGGDVRAVRHEPPELLHDHDGLPELHAARAGGEPRDAAADDGHVRLDRLLNERLVDLRGRCAPGIAGLSRLGIGIVLSFDKMHILPSVF